MLRSELLLAASLLPLVACNGGSPSDGDGGGGTVGTEGSATTPEDGTGPAGTTDCTVTCGPVDSTGMATTDPDTTETGPGTQGEAVQLSVGPTITCAVMDDGTAQCWGRGGGYLDDPLLPTSLFGLGDVVEVSMSERHGCALLGDGTVRCWGDNSDGQLGDGTETASESPVVVNDLDQVTQIEVGDIMSCALRADGGVRCWGDNGMGVLADGTTDDQPNPVDVMGLPGPVEQIECFGFGSTCARLDDGSLACWGRNENGQLGLGTTTGSDTPLLVMIDAVSSIGDVIGSSPCAVRQGAAHCWGYGLTPSPMPVAGLENVEQISAGTGNVCAVVAGGAVQCFGWANENGQLGPGLGIGETSETPVDVPLPGPAVQVVSGIAHSCALLSDGAVYCWGLDDALGNGASEDSPTPVRPTGL